MSLAHIDVAPELKRVGRHFGYAVAILINLAMLIFVQYILDWGWLPFLTDEFAELIPWISLSLIAAIAASLVYQFNDTRTVKSTGQILVNLISLFVTYQVYQVFPFDFSGYSFDWEIVARILLIVGMVGAGIGVLAEAVNLASDESQRERR